MRTNILILMSLIVFIALQFTANARDNSDNPIYYIFEITVHDKDMYQQYQEKIMPLVTKHGGRYLVLSGRGEHDINAIGAIIGSSDNWRPDIIVVIEFETLQQSIDLFNSPQYLEIKPLRTKSSDTKFVIANEFN